MNVNIATIGEDLLCFMSKLLDKNNWINLFIFQILVSSSKINKEEWKNRTYNHILLIQEEKVLNIKKFRLKNKNNLEKN